MGAVRLRMRAGGLTLLIGCLGHLLGEVSGKLLVVIELQFKATAPL
jgi:hypothetical protein